MLKALANSGLQAAPATVTVAGVLLISVDDISKRQPSLSTQQQVKSTKPMACSMTFSMILLARDHQRREKWL
jgi:hypothetical protein